MNYESGLQVTGYKLRKPFRSLLSQRSEGEAGETRHDAQHSQHFLPRVRLLEADESVGKAYHRSASADSADHGNQRFRVTQCQHIDVVTDDQKNGYQGYRQQ